MPTNVTSTNVTFDYLHSSKDFLNSVLNNITSCVLLLNKEMELQAFNNVFKTMFSNKPDEHLLYKHCGEAIGCAYVVEEEKDCGKTSNCKYCELRASAVLSYSEKKPVYKQNLTREFYTTDSKKEEKHLQFSTRPFYFEKEYYVITIINDITQLVNKEILIDEQIKEIKRLKGRD